MSNRFGTGRLEAFSDGVFAIAITLLVLEISVPERDFENLWKGIVDQWPSYLAYATSFITIGGLWAMHHAIFRRLASADGVVIRLNILLLMLVSFLPFPTKLVAEAIHLTSAERAAVIFYGLVLLSISIVTAVLWRYVVSHRDLLEPEVTDDVVMAMTSVTTPSIGFYRRRAAGDPRAGGRRFRLLADSRGRRVPHARRPHSLIRACPVTKGS